MNVDNKLWGCNSYKNVWMKRGEKGIAYVRKKYSFVPYRTFTSKFTGLDTIRVKFSNGQSKYYSLSDMYKWIWES